MRQSGHAPDFTVSIVGQAMDTVTKEARFRALFAEIAGGVYEPRVKAVRVAYEEAERKAKAASLPAKQTRDAVKNATDGLKKKLPAVMWSGTFSRRAADALVQHSGLICVDLDHLDDRVESIRDLVCADSHTLGCFISPTGTGLKVILRCDPARPHIESYRAAERYLLETFGLEIDPACKDVSRLCFVSSDPDAFVADDAVPLPYPAERTEFVAPAEAKPAARLMEGLTPGDDYDQRGDLPALLRAYDWTECGNHGWTRPGKTQGISATWNKVPGRFYVFSSDAAPLEPNHVYKPWHVFALLECGGDFGAAARKLGGLGFGEQRASGAKSTPPIQNNGAAAMDVEWADAPSEQAAPSEPAASRARRGPRDFKLPPDDDASILLGNRYLNRGDGAILSGSSGMGKSSMSLQMAFLWALGRPAFGIRANGPLRSLVVQAEDSDGDVAEMWASMSRIMQLSEDQMEQVNERVEIYTERVLRGAPFVAMLKARVAVHKPDLVWINPLQAFMDGDVTDSQDLGGFLRGDLNRLNNPPTFGYFIVHHTTKPATSKDRAERLWHEVMYDMAGGAEIINWARAILSLRAGSEEGQFNLILAKRGRRAGVTKAVEQGAGAREEIITTIPLKHSEGRIEVDGIQRGLPAIFWAPRPPDERPETETKKGGRPEKFTFEDYRNLFPAHSSPGLELGPLCQRLQTNLEIKKPVLHNALKRWAAEGRVEIISNTGHPNRYRLPI